MYSNRTIARLGLATLLGAFFALGSTDAEAACDAVSPTCSVGSAGSMKAQLTKRIGTEIDSGWMDKGLIKVRTRFTVDSVGSDPIVSLDMSKGAMLEASWPEPGTIELRPAVAQDARGTMNVHYTLTPSLEASIYGVSIAYNATDLVNKLQGAGFNYNATASAAFTPWAFAGASAKGTAPALDQSTIFSLPFDTLGIATATATGTLAIQVATNPTFTFKTKELRVDGDAIKGADGVSRLPAVDGDAMDVSVQVSGDLTMQGTLQVKPVVKIDTVAGWSTHGLTKFSFSTVSKQYGGTPMPVTLERGTVHIPLPNVKLAAKGVDFGAVKVGGSAKKSVSIDSTGEMGAELSFSSSDPRFVVPSGAVRVGSKSKYDLEVQLKPSGDGPASATITVKSNDPDSPEQTFKVGANGASVEPDDVTENGERGPAPTPTPTLAPPAEDSSGCVVASVGAHAGASAWGLLGLGLAALVAARRRR